MYVRETTDASLLHLNVSGLGGVALLVKCILQSTLCLFFVLKFLIFCNVQNVQVFKTVYEHVLKGKCCMVKRDGQVSTQRKSPEESV